MRPSRATRVSTPRTVSPGAARHAAALRRALASATSTGSPSSSSSASVGPPSKAMPSCARIARRCGEREARTSVTPERSGRELREEDARLAPAGLGRVGTMDHVLADLDREVAADGSGRRLQRVRGADHLAGGLDRLLALEHHRDQRSRGDELHEIAEERLALVLGVVALGGLLVELHVLERDDPEALALEAADDLPRQPPRERVRL